MKCLSILYSLLFFAFYAQGQQTWFRLYDYKAPDQRSVSVDAIGEDIAMLIMGVNGNNGLVSSNGVTRFDKDFNEKWKTYLQYPPEAEPEEIYWYNKGFILNKNNDSYCLSTMTHEIGNYVALSGLVNKINNDGTWNWNQTLDNDSIGLEGGIHSLALAPDSLGVFALGRSVFPDASHGIFFHLSSDGEVLHKKDLEIPWLGQNYLNPRTPMTLMKDGNLALALSDDGPSQASFDYVLKLDTLGNVLHTFVNIDSTDGKACDIVGHPNGNIIYLSARKYVWLPQWGDPVREGMRVQMLSPELEVLWEDLYYDFEEPGFVFGSSEIEELEIFPNGNILAFAYHGPNATLVCYSPTGERLWEREICLRQVGLNLRYGSIAITPTGQILVSGYIYQLPNTIESRIFTMKLDSVGCLTPGCDTTYFEPLTIWLDNKDIFPLEGVVQVTPNPSTDWIRVDYLGDNPSMLSHSFVRLYDLSGRLVAETSYTPDKVISIQNLPIGLYTVNIVQNNRILWTSQLVHQPR